MAFVSAEQHTRLVQLRDTIVSHEFDHALWDGIGLRTGLSHIASQHPRLFRSAHWNDDDYPSCVYDVLCLIVIENPQNLSTIEAYVYDHFSNHEGTSTYSGILVHPTVFEIPDQPNDVRLVAVMMPFELAFQGVYSTIKDACAELELNCVRADDIWENSVVIQDIFGLIYRSRVVIADFTGRNANVMYETGVAHVLGKDVIPIAQNISHDVPFNMQHHRVQSYVSNEQGLSDLKGALMKKLIQFSPTSSANDHDDPF